MKETHANRAACSFCTYYTYTFTPDANPACAEQLHVQRDCSAGAEEHDLTCNTQGVSCGSLTYSECQLGGSCKRT